MSNTVTEKKIKGKTLAEEVYTLILHNDDVHTFNMVIKSLVKVCRHTPEQAEQCAWIVHYKGKCDVKRGALNSITPMFEALCERGLSVTIEA